MQIKHIIADLVIYSCTRTVTPYVIGKPIMLSHLVFREIRILNIEWAVVL